MRTGMKDKPLTIGVLAKTAKVNIETVRYYQRFGIIDEPPKPADGYRIYPAETIDRIRFIKRAQQLGFSLKEIAELLELGDGHCDDVRLRAEEKQAHIDAQIKDLRMLRGTLDKLIKACQSGSDTAHCPIVDTLTGK
ncbi:MAG: Hg(II)-responsive transcriptional regulator [Gammaproteobacteria bacterium]|nr:Hg(II)-responsive transcriptional regulator [Gammaproteobacteria bacterium]